MKLNKIMKIVKKATKMADKNAPALLTGMCIVGVIATGVAAYKAGLKADEIIKEKRKDLDDVAPGDEETEKIVKKELVKEMVPVVLPPIIMGGATIAAALGSNRVASKRIALLSAAYQLSETTVKDLNKKMVEVVGEKKAKAIKEKISKDKVDKNPPKKDGTVIVTGNGDVLCYDSQSGRYFKSNADKVRRAILDASKYLHSECFVSLNDFYDILGLPRIGMGDDIGWHIDDLHDGTIPVELISHLTGDDVPCLALEYDTHIIRDWYGDFRSR